MDLDADYGTPAGVIKEVKGAADKCCSLCSAERGCCVYVTTPQGSCVLRKQETSAVATPRAGYDMGVAGIVVQAGSPPFGMALRAAAVPH